MKNSKHSLFYRLRRFKTSSKLTRREALETARIHCHEVIERVSLVASMAAI